MSSNDARPSDRMPLLILAGGRATRLKELSNVLPKYLMPVSDGRTFADVHLEWARDNGFQEILLCVGHFAEKIKSYCGNGKKYGLKIKYLEDGPVLLGTGGAISQALIEPFEEVAVTYGDTLLSFDVQDFTNQFNDSKKVAGMTVFKNAVPGHQCNINLNQEIVTYNKLEPDASWQFIDYGFLLLKRQFILQLPKRYPLDLSETLSEASYQQQVFGYEVRNRFWEIGSPEALGEFQRRF